MVISKGTPSTVLSNKTAAAAGATTLTDCTTIDTNTCIALAIEVKVTYGSAATLAGTVKIFASYDDSNYDTDPIEQFDLPFTTNTTKSQSFNVMPGPRYLKVQIVNNETAGSNKDITAAYVYAHQQDVS
jgi:hypothetical protein